MTGYNDDTLDEFPRFGSSQPSIYHDRDEAARIQDATEAMIRMREPRQSSPHPDPRDELIVQLVAALRSSVDALRSFQYGNSSQEFAERMADHAAEAIARAKGWS